MPFRSNFSFEGKSQNNIFKLVSSTKNYHLCNKLQIAAFIGTGFYFLGINIKKVEIKRDQKTFTFCVWDFAGGKDYYAIHQCFLSQSSLYLLLWDIQLKEKGVKDLEHWLDALATRLENCSLIVVGTKLDLVKAKNVSQFEERMHEEMRTLLASKPIYQKIKVYKVLHFSSNVRYKDFRSCKFQQERQKNRV